jgi:DNA-directed RNA polymerase specialized sigma24 family protein
MSEHSITQFIHLLRDGDPNAATPIWNHFYNRLVTLANRKLKSRVRRTVEGEDVAQSVFDSCFRAVQEGRVPDLKNRDNLWALLVTITERKAFNTNRNMTAQKRGGGEVLGESVFLCKSDLFSPGIAGVAGDEPTPEFVAMFAEEVDNRLKGLPEDSRQIVSLMLEGYKQNEIARKTGFSLAKVERKISIVRKQWDSAQEESGNPDGD